ncbi:MAG: aminoacyl-tRNA hydrolase [Gammaproteobacteria bacterium]
MNPLVVGIGNPGAQYAATRHNAGFWFIGALAARLGAPLSPKKNFHGDFAAAPCRMLRPSTFMNHSGRAVSAVCRYFQIAPQNVLVAHDEADLPPGAVKLKFGGGDAGHNGLADISRALGAREYWRLRIGVGRNANQDKGGDIAAYVLARAPQAERDNINRAISRALESWPQIAAGEWQNAMLMLHTPAEPEKKNGTKMRNCRPPQCRQVHAI